jgi:hypothetical protein
VCIIRVAAARGDRQTQHVGRPFETIRVETLFDDGDKARRALMVKAEGDATFFPATSKLLVRKAGGAIHS